MIVEPSKGSGSTPIGRRNPAIVQGLANLVENAVDFAEPRSRSPPWTDARWSVTITDDGPASPPASSTAIGEPYVTTRDEPGVNQASAEAGGLGLGFFIAKTLLLERTGATVHLQNRRAPAHGAIVRIAWPRASMDGATVAVAPRRALPQEEPAWRRAVEFLHP